MLEGHTDLVTSAEFNQNGSLVVSASGDRSIRIWNAQTGECIKMLEGHTDLIRLAEFNQDGTLVVSASDDRSIRIWDVKTSVCLKVINASSSKVSFKRTSFKSKV